MKKVIYTCSLFLSVFICSSYAAHASASPADKHVFKSTDREINMDIERKMGEVALYFQSLVFNSFDEILIERCGSDNGSYSVCKTIEVADAKIVDGYYQTTDKYPLPSHKDCYYRIKTVGKDGSMKTFPPVLLPGIIK